MGLPNHRPVPHLEYLERAENDLSVIKEQANAAITQEVALLAVGGQSKVLLIPAPEVAEIASDPSKALVQYQAQVTDHLHRQAELLAPLAEEHEELLNARFMIEAEITYHPLVTVYTDKLILEIKTPGEPMRYGFTYQEDNRVSGDEVEGVDFSDPLTPERLIGEGYTILSFKLLLDIEMRSQIERVISLHAERVSAQQ